MTAPLVAKAPCDVDVIARELARCAAMAAAMPPAWDGAKVAHGFTGTSGENLGRVLPGRGLALASDLKALGITKPIPYVFEKTLAMKAVEAFGGRERLAMAAAAFLVATAVPEAVAALPLAAGAITNYDGIINARANGKGEDVVLFCANQTTVGNQWHSLLRSSLQLPGGTFAPAAAPGEVTNRLTSGALSAALSNPSGSDKKYLLSIGFTSTTTINQVILFDLLAAVSGINAHSNVTQSIGTPALTRYAGGSGNLVAMEVTTALGVSNSDFRITSYTNQAGTTGRASGNSSMITSSIVGRLAGGIGNSGLPFTRLADGDIGVRSVEAVRFTYAMGAGVLNLYIYRPLHFLPGVGQNIYVERDSTVQIDGLTELVVGTDSELGYLGFFVLPTGTVSGSFTAFVRTVSG